MPSIFEGWHACSRYIKLWSLDTSTGLVMPMGDLQTEGATKLLQGRCGPLCRFLRPILQDTKHCQCFAHGNVH
jgi:hypothetical protein